MRRFFEEEQPSNGEPTFSLYDFKKWLSKEGNGELENLLDENAKARKKEEKEELKNKFKKRVKDKIEKKKSS